MMPEAKLPAMPSASTSCLALRPSAAPTPAAAPMTPKIAVGWKPALCTAFGTTVESRHMVSVPTAMPKSAAAPSALVALAGRQHRRHHHRAGMHRAALEGVVEILAMRGGAVDEGGAGRAQRAGVADRRARPVVVAAGERGLDVVLVARGDAEAGDVDQQILAFAAHGGRQLAGIERGDARGKLLGDGNLWEGLPVTMRSPDRDVAARIARRAGCWPAPPRRR